MKPSEFDYIRAADVEEAVTALANAGEDARVIAGGQSLGPMLNLRLARPEVLIDISKTPSLQQIKWDEHGLTLKCSATQAALLADAALLDKQPLLADAMPWIGHVQTRARGTVCGSLAHADPAAELPLLFSVIGGSIFARSARGDREIPSKDFYLGMFETALAPDELLLSVRFDLPKVGTGHAFKEVAERHGDFAIVAVAATADARGITFGLGGVSDRPTIVRWEGLDLSGVRDAVEELALGIDPYDDQKADATYRRRLVRKLGTRVTTEALERRHAL